LSPWTVIVDTINVGAASKDVPTLIGIWPAMAVLISYGPDVLDQLSE
jgi:hypothetical protein